MKFDLNEIKMQLQGEDYREVFEMLIDEEIIYIRRDKGERKTYFITFSRDREEEDNPYSMALVISARDEEGREAHGYRYPTSLDSFFDSCIDIVNKLRESGK